MKKLIIIFLTAVLVLPLYAQNVESDAIEEGMDMLLEEGELSLYGEEAGESGEGALEHQPGRDLSEKKPFNFTRQKFEIGIDAGVGIDNDLMSMSDILSKDMVLDLNKLGNKVGDDGVNINADLFTGFFVNVRMEEDWGFGFYAGVDGALWGNLPRSLLTLMTEGNFYDHVFSGTIGASGGVFANAGLTGFVRLPNSILDGKLRIGFSPAVYSPIIYIPGSSGITYHLNTERDIELWAEGAIDVYSMFNMDPDSSGDVSVSTGFDLSLDAEYALLSYLDVGISLFHIPIVSGDMQYKMEYRLDEFRIPAREGETLDLLGGDSLDLPDLTFNEVYDSDASFKVYRPFRFDAYAVFQPLPLFLPDFSKPELLTVRPNLGFTVDITDGEGYFNFGINFETLLFNNLFFAYLGTGYTETIWAHRLGFAVNLRAFELDLEGSLRSQSFASSFQGAGYGVSVGLRFGW